MASEPAQSRQSVETEPEQRRQSVEAVAREQMGKAMEGVGALGAAVISLSSVCDRLIAALAVLERRVSELERRAGD